MKLQVEASESSVIMQKDDDSYPSDTIVEQAGDQHALLKNPKSMDKKEEYISGDASEEFYISPETTAETIKLCLPGTGISSVGDTEYTHDDIRHEIPSTEKGDMESTFPKEQQAEIMQTSVQECAPVNRSDSIDNSEVTDVEDEKTKINAEVSQTSSMLLKPDIQETAEYGSDKMENENFSKQVLPPIIEEKSIEQPFLEESSEIGNIIAQPEAEDDSSMKTAEIQVQNKHRVLTEDQEGKSSQDLGYEKESDNEGMSPEDAQQISEKISESRNVSCADEEAEPTSEPRQSDQEVLESSQIICEGANDSKENVNDNSTEKEVTTSTEEMLVDSSSTIENCSKKIESEIYESKTISSEDGAYVDQLGGCATIEATEKSSQVDLAAEPGPANIQENDEHQSCQTEVEENETISEMVKQNRSFPESYSQEKNVIPTESMSYDNANMTNAALEGYNDTTDELKAEETGYSFREENVETATREPSSSDQISITDENSISFPEKGDSAISTNSDKISSLNDNENMEFIDTEAKFDIMQEVENNKEIVVAETAINDISEEIIDESDMVSEKQVDSLTLERNTDTDETALIVDSRQNIPLPEEDQLKKLTDVTETAYVAEGEKNSIEEENETICTPDTDTEKDSESNNEEIQNDSKPGQACENEPGIVKHSEIVNPEIEETKSDQGEQNQENYIHSDALEPDGDAQTTFSNLEPSSPENHEVKIDERMEDTVFEIEQKNIENVDLPSIRDVTSAEENLEDSTNSAIGENNVTSEASINKIDDQNENENQSLIVTCEQTGTEAEDTINKTDDSEKEIDLQYTEEKQSTRDATAENFQCAVTDEIEDHKNLENTNADPSQQHDEPNTNNSNYNEESNEFHSEDESNTEEAKNQVYEEESSSNKEGIGRTVEVSQSQDGCSKVDEDSIHVIEVEETTDKQHEKQADRSPYDEHDGVLADQGKAMDADIDSQKENELSTSNSDGEHVPEDQTERDFCKNDEMDESDTIKDKEIISQEFEQDKLVNRITSQISSPHTEPLEHNLGAVNPAMDDPTASKPSEIVNDEALTVEASKAAELEAEQHIQTNEDPEQENDISADKEFQEMNDNPMELSDNAGTESDNIEVQNDGQDDEGGVCDDTTKTVLVMDTTIEGEISTGIPSQSGKLNQEIYADDPVTSRDEGTGESSEVMQVADIHGEVSADCPPKEVIHLDPGTDLQQVQEDQRGHQFLKSSKMDESHPEKDKELINEGVEQDSMSSDMTCQKTSVVIETLRQDIGTAMDDHKQNETSEIANDKAHIVEVSKEADFETEQQNQTNEEPEQKNEISAEEGMDVKNHEFIPESAELREVNNTENEAINSRAADQGSNNVEDLSGNENTNSEISQKVTILDEDPRVNTEVRSQDISVENRELVPPSAELTEENNTENEAINSRADDLGSNTVEDLSENENTNLEISLKEISLNENSTASTEAVLQNTEVENHELIPESTELREQNHTENEAINSRVADLDANTIEDLSGNENTYVENSQKVAKLDDDPRVNTEVVPQDMSVENRELVSESAELAEENNIENEASNGSVEDLCLKTAENSENENRNLESSQKEINTEVVLQDMDVENHEVIPESTELREENNTENEAINSTSADLGSSTVEDLNGNENTNSEILEKVINLNEDPTFNTELMLQDKSVENREIVPKSAELAEEKNTENEAISSRAVYLGSLTVEDLSGNENTNSEISQKEISLNEDPVVNREVVLQVMDVENHEVIPESTELREENNTENEAINSRGEDLGSDTIEDHTEYENTNSEIPQKEINSDEDPTVNTDIVPQDIEVENHELIPESTELREDSNTENEAINIRAVDLSSNIVEDLSGNENTNSAISQKVTNLDEDPRVDTEVVLQGMSIENRAIVQESAELTEENNTENKAINCRAEDLGSNTVEDGGNENTNLENSQKEISLNENPIDNTDIVVQDMDVENHELIPETTELREENNTENEAIKCRAVDLGSDTAEGLSENENTNSEISQKSPNLEEENNTEVMPQVMDVENLEFLPESRDRRKENNIEDEAINSRGEDLGSNTIEDLTENENTNLEISQREINSDEDPTVVPQDMDVENHELIPESTELREEDNTENEAINRIAADLGSNIAEDLSGNENTNSEMSQTATNLVKDPRVDTEVVPQDMSIENHGFLPESTEIREENNTENEAVNSIAGTLDSNTVEDLSGNKIINFEISQKEINLDEDSIAGRKVVVQDMDVENHEFIPESTELQEEDNIENEAINSRSEDLGSTIIEDFSGKENTNLEISQKEISLNEDPIVDTEVVLQDMDVENHVFIPGSTELIEEKNTENEAINSKAEDLGPNTAGDIGGNENTNSEISQKEINLNEDPIVKVDVLQAKDKIQVERESTQEGSQHTLAEERTIDQEKPIDTADAPQLENEEKTCMYDEQIQEVKEPDEQSKFIEMNESVSSKNQECESHGFEDDCTGKREQNKQTRMHSEASGQKVGTEMPNQDNEECRIDASEVNNTKEVPEHDEHRNEALVDKIKEQEVICTNASSSGNEMDTRSSEVKNDETLLLPEQTTEPPPGISQTNIADRGLELGVREQSIEGNEEEGELDSNKTKFNVEMVVDSIEEIRHKDDREGIPLDQEDPNHFASQDYERNRQPTVTQSGNGILTAIEPSQYIEELESNDAKQEENVSNVTNSSINGHDTDEMTADETVETQGKQPVEPQENFLELSSPSEATSKTQVEEDSSVTLKDLNEEKEEDSTPEKATQRELQVSSDFELFEESGDLPHKPTVEEVSKTEEYLVPETQGANDPLDSEKMEPQSCTDSYSHETESEADQFQTVGASFTDDPSVRPISEKYGHTSEGVAENEEENRSPAQLIESNSEEQTVEDIIDKRDHQAVKSEMTVEESTVEENYESQGTPAYNTIEEKKEISIETKPLEEVDNIGDDTQSSRVEELKDENAYETGGCEGDTVTIEETVFHGLGMSNSSHGNQGIDTNIEDENSVPIKDNYTLTSADDVMVAEDEHHGNTQSERTSITIDAGNLEEVRNTQSERTSITIDAGNLEEKQVPAGPVEIVERSSEPVLFKESKKDEDEIMEEKEETNADAESHEPEFYKIDNDAGTDEKTLSNTECNTKSDECSITVSKDSNEISKEPNILVTSTSLEGEAVEENFQQSTSGERTENEVRPMEPKMDASELLHQMNVPKPDNMDVEEEKQQESAKGLECCSTLEPQQGNDRKLFAEMEVPEGVSSREIDSGHSEAKLKVDEIQSEGKFSNDVHMDCQDAEKIGAAEIIASQEIEIEDELKQPSSEHQKQIPETSTLVTDANEKTFEEEVLHEESTENTFKSFDNPNEIVCAPEEREIEPPSLEAEPNRDLEQKQDSEEKHRTMDDSVRTDPTELSEFQGVETSAEVKSDTEDSTLEMLNVKEVCHLNEKSETDQSSQFNLNSQPISGENPGNSCKISTDKHTKTESFEEVKELKSEKLAVSDEIGNDTHLQTVKKELMSESSPLNFEVFEAVAPGAAGEEAMQDVYTTVSSEDHVLVQQSLPTTQSCDETEKPLIADEHSANTTFSVSQVSGINNTPPTETNASEEKVSEQPAMGKVSNQDSNITQTMQVDKEEQLQGNYDDIPQSSQLQDKCGKNSVNMRNDEHVDTVDVIYNGMNAEDFSKEGSESNTNEVPSLEPMQSLTTSKEEITAEKHNETEVKSMPLSTIGNEKGGEWVVVTQNPQDDEKRAADEPKTETGKEDTRDDLGAEDSELIPMISRDIELKTQNKKSHNILSGMGSKMKNSISKVKKAMACTSPQFSPDDVIIKLNKSKKS